MAADQRRIVKHDDLNHEAPVFCAHRRIRRGKHEAHETLLRTSGQAGTSALTGVVRALA